MQSVTPSAVKEVHLRLVNPRTVVTMLVLEPWGESFAMPGGAVFELVARGPEGDELEVSQEDDVITVWGWPGSVVRVFCGQTELGYDPERRPPVPGGGNVAQHEASA